MVKSVIRGAGLWAMSMTLAAAHHIRPDYYAASSSTPAPYYPTYAPPAPVYEASSSTPEPYYPTYAPPAPVYVASSSAPAPYYPTYAPPAPVYVVSSSTPAPYYPTYAPPAPVYVASSSSPPPYYPTYAPPAPVYSASSSTPAPYYPTYAPPAPVYSASSSTPAPYYPTYAPPAPVYTPSAAYSAPPPAHTGCPATYGNTTVHAPKHFKLIVKSASAKSGFLFLTPGGALKEDIMTAATFEITSEHKLGKVMAATDPSPFYVGAEHSSDASTSMGLLPYCTPESMITAFSLVKCDCVTIGTGYFSHYLKWSDEKFLNGEATFGVVGEVKEGSTVVASLTKPAESGEAFRLYAHPA